MTATKDDASRRAARRRMAERADAARAELIVEITEAAARIAAAQLPEGGPAFRNDGVLRLLTTIARAPYCCSLSDVGRLMKISRQHAQRLAQEAELAGFVELARNHDDRRIVQLLITPRGRAEIDRANRSSKLWLAELLLGLDRTRLQIATHVVRVIRQRLVRNEQLLSNRRRR